MHSLLVLAAAEEKPFSPLSPQLSDLIWSAVFFFVLFGLIWKFVLPKLGATLDARAQAVAGQVSAAEATRSEADGVLADYRAKLADAQAQAQRIIDEGRRTGETIVADARSRADAEAQQLVARAQAEIAGERDRAISALRAELAGLSIELASRVVGKSLDTPAQRALVDSYIDELATSAQ